MSSSASYVCEIQEYFQHYFSGYRYPIIRTRFSLFLLSFLYSTNLTCLTMGMSLTASSSPYWTLLVPRNRISTTPREDTLTRSTTPPMAVMAGRSPARLCPYACVSKGGGGMNKGGC